MLNSFSHRTTETSIVKYPVTKETENLTKALNRVPGDGVVEQCVDVVLVVGVVLVGDLGVDEPPLGQHEEVWLPLEVVLILQVRLICQIESDFILRGVFYFIC